MLKSFEGVYREGRVELLEQPPADAEGKVIVTFLGSGAVDLGPIPKFHIAVGR